MKAKELIKIFDLKAHPEGGFYKEIYRSKEIIKSDYLSSEFEGDRNFCTSIYFLLTSDKFSSFHKINQDETWHFYKGSCIELHIISPEGKYNNVKIGSDIINGEVPQFTVPAKHYFAAEVLKKDSYAFVGCTVSPGFDFRDFFLPKRSELLKKYPKLKKEIQRLTYA